MRRVLLIELFLQCLVISRVSALDLQFSTPFESFMVLQRDVSLPVWGTGTPGQEVRLEFAGQTVTSNVRENGTWTATLAPLAVSAVNRSMIATSEGKVVVLDSILVGDVWIGSGQSNMYKEINKMKTTDSIYAETIASAPYSTIRVRFREKDDEHLDGWLTATAEHIDPFSSLLFNFARALNEELAIPIGVMLAHQGGTPTTHFVSHDGMVYDSLFREAVKDNEPLTQLLDQLQTQFDSWWNDTSNLADSPIPPEPGLGRNEREETTIGSPGRGFYGYSLPLLRFEVKGLLWDQGENGTGRNDAGYFPVTSAMITSYRRGLGNPDLPVIVNQKPSGEGCAFAYADNVYHLFSESYQALPVSPPDTSDSDEEMCCGKCSCPYKGGAARIEYNRIMRLHNVALAPTIDLGGGTHPKNKKGYGYRAARTALGFVYGKNIEIYGPIYNGHVVEGAAMRISLSHAESGLTARHSNIVQGFEMCGPDSVFYWADATIEGTDVVVSSPSVSQPVAVRYGFALQRPWANLFNNDSLPAFTFITDSSSLQEPTILYHNAGVKTPVRSAPRILKYHLLSGGEIQIPFSSVKGCNRIAIYNLQGRCILKQPLKTDFRGYTARLPSETRAGETIIIRVSN